MKKNLLLELHNEILEKEGIYSIYAFIAVIVFSITIVDIKPLVQVFRIILATIPLVILVLVYIKFKNLRPKEEDIRIRRSIIFFVLLTIATIVDFIRHLGWL